MSSLRDYDPAEAGLIYIDANIFIHVLLNDPRFGATCKAFLTRVEKGDAEARLSPLVIDEIAYKIIVEKLKAELGLATVREVLRQNLTKDWREVFYVPYPSAPGAKSRWSLHSHQP